MAKGSSVWRFTQAPKPLRHALLKGKAGELYDQLHLAWRAGAISDFGYGEGYGKAHELQWLIDGHTFTADQLDMVRGMLLGKLAARGIVSLAFGERWCGFLEAVVTYKTGQVLRERYDGCKVVVETEEMAA